MLDFIKPNILKYQSKQNQRRQNNCLYASNKQGQSLDISLNSPNKSGYSPNVSGFSPFNLQEYSPHYLQEKSPHNFQDYSPNISTYSPNVSTFSPGYSPGYTPRGSIYNRRRQVNNFLDGSNCETNDVTASLNNTRKYSANLVKSLSKFKNSNKSKLKSFNGLNSLIHFNSIIKKSNIIDNYIDNIENKNNRTFYVDNNQNDVNLKQYKSMRLIKPLHIKHNKNMIKNIQNNNLQNISKSQKLAYNNNIQHHISQPRQQRQLTSSSIENTILRKNILNMNGWPQFNLFEQTKLKQSNQNQIKKSFTDQHLHQLQMPRMNSTKTYQLPKLGTMGRQVRSSRMSQLEFQLNYQYKVRKESIVIKQITQLLE